MEVKWTAQPGDPLIMKERGVIFRSGEWTKIDDKTVDGQKIANNPVFEVKGAKGAEEAEDPELNADPAIFAARSELDKRQVKWHHKSGLAKLQQQVADYDAGVKPAPEKAK